MRVRIDDIICLQNWRQEKKNKKEGKPLFHKKLSKANLGRIMFPEAQNNQVSVRMSKLKRAKMIRPEWVGIWCEEGGVDPNFIFGFKSKHDKDFEKALEW